MNNTNILNHLVTRLNTNFERKVVKEHENLSKEVVE